MTTYLPPASVTNPAIDPAWLQALGAGSLVPRSLAAWEPLVLEGLAHFLNLLPASRIEALTQAQLDLGLEASLPQRLTTLLLQSPTLHKLGQVLARQPHLPAELRAQLRQLESMPAHTDSALVAQLVARLQAHVAGSATPAPALQIADTPLAEGSVALILPFSWQEAGLEQQGVFKVLRPGVSERLHQELDLLPAVADFLTRRGAALGLPALDYRGTLDGVATLLRQEIQLEREQAHLRAARAFYAGTPEVLIPRLLPWCAPWATAMERVHGTFLTDITLAPHERRRLAHIAIDALLAQPFWCARDPAIFHGDLHGGNLMCTDDGRLAVLDWALVTPIDKATREALVHAVIGALTWDAGQLHQSLARLNYTGAADPALHGQVEQALDALLRRGGLHLAGFDWLLGVIDRLALQGLLHADPTLSAFRKTWLSLAGVLAELDGSAAPDTALIQRGLTQFLAEWPQRWSARPGDATPFGTHVSNLGLANALLAAGFSGWHMAWRYGAMAWTHWHKP